MALHPTGELQQATLVHKEAHCSEIVVAVIVVVVSVVVVVVIVVVVVVVVDELLFGVAVAPGAGVGALVNGGGGVTRNTLTVFFPASRKVMASIEKMRLSRSNWSPP